ncbi:class I SAM-dependent DNA methyltransferase [Lacticigenium naphthae]|uniref:class I SAM-dependent DNA methyltransferase n=1 Tax=Lacticigenium naphthae TaxID=515351 RepID=UPI0003FDB280|nr:class I SAM-dependent methyltransferase [Lacticigenium naphthae]
MSYQKFAYVYDEIMDDTLYDKWFDFTQSHTNGTSMEILELACGTGKLGLELSKAGHAVVGLDLSEEMLTEAYSLQMDSNNYFPLIQGDMRDLESFDSKNIITCYSDSLCYLSNENEMLSMFKEVNAKLKEKGYFLFDVHSIHKINDVFPGYMFHADLEKATFLWSSYKGEVPNSIEHDLTFFILNETNHLYERFDETHKERTYPMQKYREMLKEAGFSKVSVTANFGSENVKSNTERWFFSCQK